MGLSPGHTLDEAEEGKKQWGRVWQEGSQMGFTKEIYCRILLFPPPVPQGAGLEVLSPLTSPGCSSVGFRVAFSL